MKRGSSNHYYLVDYITLTYNHQLALALANFCAPSREQHLSGRVATDSDRWPIFLTTIQSTMMQILNVLSWLGWFFLLQQTWSIIDETWTPTLLSQESLIMTSVLALEGACFLEVINMAVSGTGNVALGVALHYTRVFVATVAWPAMLGENGNEERQSVIVAILMAWGMTEICRYPYYIFRTKSAEKLRYAVPIVTFPIGAGAEAVCCYYASQELQGVLKYMALAQCAVNVFGFFAAYPMMAKRGFAKLGLIKAKKKTKQR